MSAKMDLVLEEGEKFTDSSIWKDSTKTPIPMLDWTASLEIREATHIAPELTLIQGTGITLGVSDGTVLIEVEVAQIAALTFLSGLYTLILTDTSSVATMYSRGTITIINKEDV